MAGIFDRARSYWPDEGSVDFDRIWTIVEEDVAWKNGDDIVFNGFKSQPRLEMQIRATIDDTMDFMRSAVTVEAYIKSKGDTVGTTRFSIPSAFVIFRFDMFTQEEAAEFISGIRANDMWDGEFKEKLIEKVVDLMRRNDSPDIDDATRLFVEMI
jgi:hypothetical protein